MLLTTLLALFNAEVETELEGGGVIQKQCVARVSVEILPREKFLAVIPDHKPEMQTLIQMECLLVLVNIWGVFSSVSAFFLSSELGFNIFTSSLDDKLVLRSWPVRLMLAAASA